MGCFAGHCALSGLPICDGDQVVVVKMTPGAKNWLKGRLNAGYSFGNVHDCFRAEGEFTYETGRYNDYGATYENPELSGDFRDPDRFLPYLFVHPAVWEMAQKEGHSGLSPITNFFNLAFCLRRQLTWQPSILGSQYPDRREYVVRKKFLNMISAIASNSSEAYHREMGLREYRMELVVYWFKGAPDGSLLGFPYEEGQFLDREGESEWCEDVGSATYIDLGDREAITRAQAKFLEMHEWCCCWETREVI